MNPPNQIDVKRGIQCVQVLAFAILGGLAFQRANAEETKSVQVQQCLVTFAKEVEVPALESGLVAQLHVRRNDLINQGEPIADLDDRLVLRRRKAAGLRLDLAKAAADTDAEVRYAEKALIEAKEELRINARIQSDSGGSIARQRMRQLTLAAEHASVEVVRAKQRYNEASVSAKLQQAEVSVLDDQLRNFHSDSPLSGVVLDVGRSVGEWIEKGETIATVAQIDRLHVHALVGSDQIAPTACAELPVSVYWQDPTTSTRRVLHGHVLSVDPQRLPDGYFRLHAEIINQTEPTNSELWQLNPGAKVQMVVHIGSAGKNGASARRTLDTMKR